MQFPYIVTLPSVKPYGKQAKHKQFSGDSIFYHSHQKNFPDLSLYFNNIPVTVVIYPPIQARKPKEPLFNLGP